ncbi:MAG: hypothetical protein JSS91_11105 [Bacteroidetes bacterium]|nr:hypothetical protein [Bacteroidota bacterium]
MKNSIRIIFFLFFSVIFLSPLYSQGNIYNYTNAKISFWYPDDWMVREHLLLLLMPQSENLQIQFQISETVNLNEAVKESMNELKLLYPDDSIYIVKDYTIHKLKVKDMEGIIQNNKVKYLLLETPEKKIIKISYSIPKDLALEYNDLIQKIINSLKPIN